MKTKHYLLLLFGICLVVYACRKIELNNTLVDTKTKAEAWLKENGGNYKSQTMRAQLPDSSFVQGKLSWEQGSVFIADSQTYLRVPFIFETFGKNIPANNKDAYTTYQLVFRVKDTGFNAALQITLLNGTITDVSTKKKQTATLQTYFSLNGKKLNSYWRRASDVRASAISFTPIPSDVIYKLGTTISRPNKNIGNTHGTIAYTAEEGGSGDGDCTLTEETHTVPGPSYSLSDGTVVVTTIRITDYNYVCTPHTQQEISWLDDSPGGGYPDDIPEAPPEKTETDSFYFDTSILNNPCSNAALTKVLGANDSIVNLVKNVFGTSATVNLIFKEVSGLTSADGTKQVLGRTDYTNNGKQDTIYLNSSLLNGTSQEYIASVIIHEMTHAYLANTNPTEFYNQLASHKEMAIDYIGKFVATLTHLYPTLPEKNAAALCIQGLNDVSKNYPELIDALRLQYGFDDSSEYGDLNSVVHYAEPYSEDNNYILDPDPSVPNQGRKGTRCQ
ncbi:hypothetical protein A9P82_08170 [Arachidicoccus ginsenosidimutans]|uniref:SprT-like domain-containing protein n=1 Tax=Arachidicoccus sp. BS20 TaxID=1850526 RepID=UPI0007F065E5|nr:SprT-like domain-containing protein [Arachidicoccus sp. BS20]ANI89268.1 hypothetical protein A9P82_08170 [Arachidicoccus sp. BS20]